MRPASDHFTHRNIACGHTYTVISGQPLSGPSGTIEAVTVINRAPRHEGVWGSRGRSICILKLGTERKWLAYSVGRFIPRKTGLGTYWVEGWIMSPRDDLHAAAKINIPAPTWKWEPG